MSKLSFTVDTEDTLVVREVSEMLLRLSGHAELPMPQVSNFAAQPTHVADEQAATVTPVETYTPAPIEADVDAKGFPWDERIHSSSKEKIQNGTWKYKRGVYKDIVAQVELELRGNVPTTSPTQISEPTVTPNAEVTTEQTPPPPPPPPPPPASAVESNAPATFAELMQRITANKVPLQKLQAWCTDKQLGSFTLLGQASNETIAEAAKALGV